MPVHCSPLLSEHPLGACRARGHRREPAEGVLLSAHPGLSARLLPAPSPPSPVCLTPRGSRPTPGCDDAHGYASSLHPAQTPSRRSRGLRVAFAQTDVQEEASPPLTPDPCTDGRLLPASAPRLRPGFPPAPPNGSQTLLWLNARARCCSARHPLGPPHSEQEPKSVRGGARPGRPAACLPSPPHSLPRHSGLFPWARPLLPRGLCPGGRLEYMNIYAETPLPRWAVTPSLQVLGVCGGQDGRAAEGVSPRLGRVCSSRQEHISGGADSPPLTWDQD